MEFGVWSLEFGVQRSDLISSEASRKSNLSVVDSDSAVVITESGEYQQPAFPQAL